MWKEKLMGFLQSALITFAMMCLPKKQKQSPHVGCPLPQRFLILGHRGARQHLPENTLSAFRMATQQVDGIELDVHLSQDEIPMVIHDDTLMRTTGFVGSVSDYTAAVLLGLNAAFVNPKLPSEGIPTLEAVLAAMPIGAIVNIELKSTEHFDNTIYVQRVLDITKMHRQRVLIIFSSFDPLLLLELKKQDAGYYIALLLALRESHFWQSLRHMALLQPDALHVVPEVITSFFLHVAKRKSVIIGVWTVNDKQLANTFHHRGVHILMTDNVFLMDSQ